MYKRYVNFVIWVHMKINLWRARRDLERILSMPVGARYLKMTSIGFTLISESQDREVYKSSDGHLEITFVKE